MRNSEVVREGGMVRAGERETESAKEKDKRKAKINLRLEFRINLLFNQSLTMVRSPWKLS